MNMMLSDGEHPRWRRGNERTAAGVANANPVCLLLMYCRATEQTDTHDSASRDKNECDDAAAQERVYAVSVAATSPTCVSRLLLVVGEE